jgi:hypothetical protein
MLALVCQLVRKSRYASHCKKRLRKNYTMAVSIGKSESSYQLPDRSGEPKEYLLWVNHRWLKRRWDEMTRVQKLQEIEAEKRLAYDAVFDPNGFLF